MIFFEFLQFVHKPPWMAFIPFTEHEPYRNKITFKVKNRHLLFLHSDCGEGELFPLAIYLLIKSNRFNSNISLLFQFTSEKSNDVLKIITSKGADERTFQAILDHY